MMTTTDSKLNYIHFDNESMIIKSDGYYYGIYWCDIEKDELIDFCVNPEECMFYETEKNEDGFADIYWDYDSWEVEPDVILRYIEYNLRHEPTLIKANSLYCRAGDIFLISQGDYLYETVLKIINKPMLKYKI